MIWENAHWFKNLKLKISIISSLDIFSHLKDELKRTVVLRIYNRSGIVTEKGVTHSLPIAIRRENSVPDLHLICMSDAKIFLILLVFPTFCYLGGLRRAVSTRKRKYVLDLDWKKERWGKKYYPSWPPKKSNYALTRSFGQRRKIMAFPSFWGCQSKILWECGYRLEFSLHLLLNSSYIPNHLNPLFGDWTFTSCLLTDKKQCLRNCVWIFPHANNLMMKTWKCLF